MLLRFCDEIVMLIDGGKPMRQNQWKKAGLTVLSAVFMGKSFPGGSGYRNSCVSCDEGRRGHRI